MAKLQDLGYYPTTSFFIVRREIYLWQKHLRAL